MNHSLFIIVTSAVVRAILATIGGPAVIIGKNGITPSVTIACGF
jgi:hypothetical protein